MYHKIEPEIKKEVMNHLLAGVSVVELRQIYKISKAALTRWRIEAQDIEYQRRQRESKETV